MTKIIKLPKEVAELISAGEVVERPSSVVKELVENAIDAGAHKITVEIENGGITYIRVTDDGCGIARDDLRTAFMRNATSKITKAEDLFDIYTLGFRGEALAAAAAVAKVDMLTKTDTAQSGAHIRAEGGNIGTPEDAGCPNGTTVIVRDLFFNTPARLKFMKRDATEAGYVASVVSRAALSAPGISFKFIKNGKQELQTPGDGKLLSAIYAIYGRDYAFSLLETLGETEGIHVSGFITKPENARANRSMQDFFVNGRHIFSKTLCAALEQAYKGRIMVGKYPCCVLNITASPALFDVNVHPAKTEIKFSDERRIFDALYRAARSALDGDLSRTEAKIDTSSQADDIPQTPIDLTSEKTGSIENLEHIGAEKTVENRSGEFGRSGIYISGQDFDRNDAFKSHASLKPDAESKYSVEQYIKRLEQRDGAEPVDIYFDLPQSERCDSREQTKAKDLTNCKNHNTEQEKIDATANQAEDYKVIGEAFKTYIIVEHENDFIIIDKHAAHERIIFNKISAQADGESSRQLLLEPYMLSLSPEETAILLQNREILLKIGYLIDEFGLGTIAVRQIPVYTEENDIAPILSEIAAKLKTGKTPEPELLTAIYEKLACTAAIKANSFTDEMERDDFARRVMSMPEIKYCPHGRPIAVQLTRRELEKMFKRV